VSGVSQAVTSKLATFRPSRHVQMVWRVANSLVTSRPCRTCGILRTTRQADKPAAARWSTNHVSAGKLRHCVTLTFAERNRLSFLLSRNKLRSAN